MEFYKDFQNDPIRFGYAEGQAFLERLNAGGRHYVPIIDSAIYVPNPTNSSDIYPPYHAASNETWLLNPDGSLYVGDVWPGFTNVSPFPLVY
jgi:alpha-glucosidase